MQDLGVRVLVKDSAYIRFRVRGCCSIRHPSMASRIWRHTRQFSAINRFRDAATTTSHDAKECRP